MLARADFATGLLFLLAVCGHVMGASFLPATRGFTQPLFTAACLATFALGHLGMGRLVSGGINLSLLIPAMTCIVPLAVLIVAVTLYGESASITRLCLIVLSVIAIGGAGLVS